MIFIGLLVRWYRQIVLYTLGKYKIFSALHGMSVRTSNEKGVCLSNAKNKKVKIKECRAG